MHPLLSEYVKQATIRNIFELPNGSTNNTFRRRHKLVATHDSGTRQTLASSNILRMPGQGRTVLRSTLRMANILNANLV